MKKYFLFLLLIVSGFAKAQNGCLKGDQYDVSCNNGIPEKCDAGYTRVIQGKGSAMKATCVCQNMPLYKSHPLIKKMQADNARQDKEIKGLQKSDAGQTADIADLKPRVKKLEEEMIGVKGDLASRPKEITFKSPEPLAPKVEPKKDPPVKKEDPSLGPPREAPKVEVPVEPSFFVEPEIGVFWQSNNSPEFISKSLWSGSVGIRLRYQPQKWKGIFLFAKPSWSMMFGKIYLPESTPSPYPIQAVSQNGFLAEAGLGYRIWEYTEISAGYAQALSKGAEHESGAFAHLEFGMDKIPLKAQLGLRYKHDLSFFGGVVARLPIKHKPK